MSEVIKYYLVAFIIAFGTGFFVTRATLKQNTLSSNISRYIHIANDSTASFSFNSVTYFEYNYISDELQIIESSFEKQGRINTQMDSVLTDENYRKLFIGALSCSGFKLKKYISKDNLKTRNALAAALGTISGYYAGAKVGEVLYRPKDPSADVFDIVSDKAEWDNILNGYLKYMRQKMCDYTNYTKSAQIKKLLMIKRQEFDLIKNSTDLSFKDKIKHLSNYYTESKGLYLKHYKNEPPIEGTYPNWWVGLVLLISLIGLYIIHRNFFKA